MNQVHESATVEDRVILGERVVIWRNAHLREGVSVGKNSTIGANVFLDKGVIIGESCKIQNNALIYAPAILSDGVFLGPGVILTNDRIPRAVNEDLSIKSADHWEPVAVTILSGASIGAGAVCVAPVTIGTWALVGAGAVVTKDVPNYGLVVGNPARQIGWVGKSGNKLVWDQLAERWLDLISGERFIQTETNELRLDCQ
jgi:acetyltransferase-like isoleucine patch superfamily enzyme